MGLHPDDVRRRLVPDEVQLQIVLGSLLGGAVIEGVAGARSLRISHSLRRARYAWWKYEQLLSLARHAPEHDAYGITFRTIAHPLFDDLAPAFASGDRDARARARIVHGLLAPLGLAVWMSDAGRIELRADLFVPVQRSLALSA